MSPVRNGLPLLDLTALARSDADFDRIAHDLDHACCEFGFFYVTGHGIAVLEPVAVSAGHSADSVRSRAPRWDGRDLATLSGTYGDYLLGKVARVFPRLGQRHLK
jgi:hypothetical protein